MRVTEVVIRVILVGDKLKKGREIVSRYDRFKDCSLDFIDISKISRFQLIKKWFFTRSPCCSIFVHCWKSQKKKRLWQIFLSLANTKERLIFENDSDVHRHSFAYVFRDTFLLMYEIIFTPLLFVFFFPTLWLYKNYIKYFTKTVNSKISDVKKVIFLRTNFSYDPKGGGSSSHKEGFTSGIQSLGYDVEFITTCSLPNIEAPMHIVEPGEIFTLSHIMNKLLFNFSFYRKAIPIIKKAKPLFLYHRHDELTFSSVLLSRRLRIPLILEFNSSEVWKKQHWGKQKKIWLYRQCEEIAVYGASHLTTVSEVNRENLGEWYGMPKEKVTTNPNGVNPDVFRPNQELRKQVRQDLQVEDKCVVGFVGSFGVWHGVKVLAAVMPEVLKKVPEAHFLWVGDGHFKKHVVDSVENNNLWGRAILTGRVSHPEIPGYLNACDILVSPHTPQVDGGVFFGSPTKLFEYMAMEKGIVASRLGQIAEILEHDKDAILVEPGNKEELCEAIIKLSNDKDLRQRIGKQARKTAENSYTWKHNAKKVVDAFLSLDQK